MADWSQFNPWGAPDFPSNAAFGTGAPAEDAQRQPNILDKLLAGFANSAATLPQRAIGAADTYSRTGEYNPAPFVEAAMLPMGTGAVAGVPVRAGEAVLGAGPIRAYHGSPHDFDRFDLSKIGTGEGAQAYGHGLYFAENPAVADLYSRVVTKNQPGWQGTMPPAFDAIAPAELAKIPDELRGRLVASWQNNGEETAKNLARKMFEESRGTPYSDALHSLAHSSEWKPPGHRYEVNINADPAHFLDWDKPLSQQPHIAQRLGYTPEEIAAHKQSVASDTDSLLAALTGDGQYVTPKAEIDRSGRPPLTATGADIAKGNSVFDSAAHVGKADHLRDAGIPGIKYLDQGSRASGDGSRNYVVFNDKLIDILRKFGLAGLAPPIFANAISEPKS